jgi:hypothetical protein
MLVQNGDKRVTGPAKFKTKADDAVSHSYPLCAEERRNIFHIRKDICSEMNSKRIPVILPVTGSHDGISDRKTPVLA